MAKGTRGDARVRLPRTARRACVLRTRRGTPPSTPGLQRGGVQGPRRGEWLQLHSLLRHDASGLLLIGRGLLRLQLLFRRGNQAFERSGQRAVHVNLDAALRGHLLKVFQPRRQHLGARESNLRGLFGAGFQ